MVILFLVFRGISILFSIVAVLIYILPTVEEDCLLPIPSPLFVDFLMMAILAQKSYQHPGIISLIQRLPTL